GPFQIGMSLTIFDQGFTKFTLPPFGSVRARTHLPPLQLTVSLQNVDLDLLRESFQDVPRKEAVTALREEARAAVAKFLVRVLVLAGVGGGFGVLFFPRRGRKIIALAALWGVLLMAVLAGAGLASFDEEAFRRPEFQGILQAGPWMIGLVEEGLVKVQALASQLEIIGKNLEKLFTRIEELEPLGVVEGDVKVLHVSDFHNNAAGITFAAQVVKSFGVDLVIDTGDLTDLGTPIESDIVERIAEIGVPYLIAPGNHENPEVLDRLRALPNVSIMDRGIVFLDGLRIIGVPDPGSAEIGAVVPTQKELERLRAELEEEVRTMPVKPDVLAAHNPRLVEPLVGSTGIPLVLAGHLHRAEIREEPGGVFVNAGTTGGAGVRGLQVREEVPYTAVLLHFKLPVSSAERPRLVAADLIKVFHLRGRFNIERVIFTGSEEDQGNTPVKGPVK
ncbi:MAG: metallophosphoesterase, partial [Firmicutes bacterium]|nr:metallophosphoesterase [Bacillota bacterium]